MRKYFLVALRFSIIDYTTDPNGITTIVDEPAGFDGVTIDLKRIKYYHGFVDNIDDSFSSLQWDGEAFKILNNAYDIKGFDAKCKCIIEFSCEPNLSPYEQLYSGYFDFTTIKSVKGDRCYIEIGVLSDSGIVEFGNRISANVDINSNKDFDGNALTDYSSKLDEIVPTPSKTLRLISKTDVKNQTYQTLTANANEAFNEAGQNGQTKRFLYFTASVVDIQDLSDFAGMGSGLFYDNNANHGFVDTINQGLVSACENGYIFTNQPDANYIPSLFILNIDQTIRVECIGSNQFFWGNNGFGFCYVHIVGQSNADWFINNIDIILNSLPALPSTYNHWFSIDSNSKVWIYLPMQVGGPYDGYSSPPANGHLDFHIQRIDWSIDVDNSQNVYSFIYGRLQCGYITNIPTMKISTQVGGYWSLRRDTRIVDSDTSVYKRSPINEVLSRITENITNDKLRVYSETFGRKDSLPYATPNNGKFGGLCIANGLRLRQATLGDGNTDNIQISMQDCLKSLNGILPIGYGVEDDPHRSGYKVVRIEDFKYFYKNNIVFVADEVNNIETDSSFDETFYKFVSGYKTWKASQYNGLDDFFSSSEWHTSLNSTSNEVDATSSFIGSPFCIEAQRRISKTSEDSQYDTYIFMIMYGLNWNSGANQFILEQGGLQSYANFLFPDDIYNVRLSPVRNAMRWFAHILSNYRQYTNGKLKFSSGEGNYTAVTQMPASQGNIIENQPIAENAYIDLSKFAHPTEYYPLWFYETVTFDYPLSYADFKNILQNPYGLIQYSQGGVVAYGWIDELKYALTKGTATFTLKKKLA